MTVALPIPLTVVAGLAAAVLIYFLVLLARNEAVFIPLPQETIDSMLKMADIRPDDVLFDLLAEMEELLSPQPGNME